MCNMKSALQIEIELAIIVIQSGKVVIIDLEIFTQKINSCL